MVEQVLKIECCGKKYTVKFDKSKNNPFWLYEHTFSFEKGYMTEHRRLVEKYANMASCLYLIAQDTAFLKDYFPD